MSTGDYDLPYFAELSKLPEAEVKKEIDALIKFNRQLQILNEEECNYGLSEFSAKRQNIIIDRVGLIATRLGCGYYINYDPRGAAIRLHRPDGRSNGWDGETWYLPED